MVQRRFLDEQFDGWLGDQVIGGGARRPNGRFVSAETGRSPTLRPGHSADPTRNIEDWQLSIPQVMYLVARSAQFAALQ